MQALSFAVHIPLVCFGIAFPALVLYVESLYLRTGDELYRTLARRWTRIMAALFAAGVVTGTILSFELGLLWPNFTGTFGSVFGLGFAIEGFSFFMEAIFIGIYIYGWSRLSPRMHFASGIPIAIAGVTGSLTVISVNGWMNHPTHFRFSDGQVADVNPWGALFGNSYFWHELTHIVPGRLHGCGLRAGERLRLWAAPRPLGPLRADGACDPAHRRDTRLGCASLHRRLERARGSDQPADQARRLRGAGQNHQRARPSTSSAGTRTAGSNTGSRSHICSRCSPSTTRTRRCRAWTPSPPTTGRR